MFRRIGAVGEIADLIDHQYRQMRVGLRDAPGGSILVGLPPRYMLGAEPAGPDAHPIAIQIQRAGKPIVSGGIEYGCVSWITTPVGPPLTGMRSAKFAVQSSRNDDEAAVARRIFDLCATGAGYSRIAKTLNAKGAACPGPQQGRAAGWSPSTVRDVLHRELYRGVLVWNRTKKRCHR